MSVSPRPAFAACLWLAALSVPAVILLSHRDPVAALDVAAEVRAWAGVAFWGGLVLIVALALLYPPFVPLVRLGWRRLKGRLGTSEGPLYEAVNRLQHLETAQNHFEVARLGRQLGRRAQALPHAVRAVELDPDHTAARFVLGMVLREIGQLDEACRQLGLVVEQEPDHAFGQALVEWGHALVDARRPEEAVAVLERHRREHGASRRTHYLLGLARRATGDHERAREDFAEAAAPPREGEHLPPEDALVRARARLQRWHR